MKYEFIICICRSLSNTFGEQKYVSSGWNDG